jgi:hypothetical protein
MRFRTPFDILPLTRGGGVQNNVGPPPIMSPPVQPSYLRTHVSCYFHPHGPPFHLIFLSLPAMCPFLPFTSTSAPSTIRCLLPLHHFHITPLPLSHLHSTGTFNLLVKHATSSIPHLLDHSADPGGASRRPPRHRGQS